MGNVPNPILNYVRGFFKSVLEKMMFEERTIFLDKELENKANGFYQRKVSSIYGEITDLQVPRTRTDGFRSALLPKGRVDQELEALIFQLYSSGISTRKIEEVLSRNFNVTLSHTSVARLSTVAYEEVHKWKNRPLAKNYAAVFIDAFYFPLKRDTVQKEAIYVALGITPEGHREVIGFWIPGGSEGASNWEEIFIDMYSRGVKDIDYIIADGLTGIANAIARVYPKANHQYCVLHACRTSLNKVRASDKKNVSLALKKIYYADSKEEARSALEEFINEWKNIYPKVTQLWKENFNSLTSFMALPNRLWQHVYTTNWIERLHKEIKRRINVMEQFQNETSAEKILYSIYNEQNQRYKNSGVNCWKEQYKMYKEAEEKR